MIINFSTLFGLLTGLLIGAIISFLITKNKINTLHLHLTATLRQLEDTKTEIQLQKEESRKELLLRLEETKKDEKQHYDKYIESYKIAQAELLANLKEQHNNDLKNQQRNFDSALQRLATQAKAATEEMLKMRQKEFADSSSANIKDIVTPLKETISKMEETMQKSSKETVSINSALQENLKMMIDQSKAAQASTDELANAFRHRSKVQGDWGETILTELLQSQGLTEGVQFETQTTLRDTQGNTIKNEHGGIMRPDVILRLDQRREIIIDSKVSLTAFFDYANAENDIDRQQFLKAHIASLQQHVKELAKKDYSAYIKPPKVRMDYVIMFVPHTGALWTALNAEPDLWRKAMEQNVYIADEQTLYGALKIVSITWTQIKQAQNHEQVYQYANEMVERVGQFVKKYEEVGIALNKAQQAYTDGQKKLSNKGQSILVSANKLIKIGAKQSSKHPLTGLIDIDEAEDLEIQHTLNSNNTTKDL